MFLCLGFKKLERNYFRSVYALAISIPNNTAIRKMDASGSESWLTSFGFYPVTKSLTVDATEQALYLVSFTNSLVVFRLSTRDGSIISQQYL